MRDRKKSNYNKNNDTFKKIKNRINDSIRVPKVRLIHNDINSIIDIKDALKMAQDEDLDLVEISPNANPPVCKILNYEKYLYKQKKQKDEQKKKERETRQNIKEIKLSQNIGEHDLDFKRKHAEEFLKDNDIVKCTLKFKGREIVYKDQATKIMLEFAQSLLDYGTLLKIPELNGKVMTMMIKPKDNNNNKKLK